VARRQVIAFQSHRQTENASCDETTPEGQIHGRIVPQHVRVAANWAIAEAD
jgi:hypothetical protein